MKNRRWGDNDKHFWPFTWSGPSSYRTFGVMLDSGANDGGGGDCHIRFSAFGRHLICELPPIIPHSVERRPVAYQREEFIARTGRDYYEEVFPRQYGHYGAQTGDSDTDKGKVFFHPWRSWRHIRNSLYGLSGEFFATLPEGFDHEQWTKREALKEACPKVKFAFNDYDGERLIATTHIEEREWLLGEGRFKWLSWFRNPRISRTLEIHFSGETGKEKGSWKGGTVGHSIEMLPGEMHEAAFKRYCEQEHRSKSGRYRVRYIGLVAP